MTATPSISKFPRRTGVTLSVLASLLIAGCVREANSERRDQADELNATSGSPAHYAGPERKDDANRMDSAPVGLGPEPSGPENSNTPELSPITDAQRGAYPWLDGTREVRSLAQTFAPPNGYQRVAVESGGFAAWLRNLPLRGADAPVRTYSGSVLRDPNDARISAVAEIDVGPRDLQQCADSVIRLHAEWLWSEKRFDEIGYHFVSGDFATWSDYQSGMRPQITVDRVTWTQSASPSDSREAFARYLDLVFTYASTVSIALREDRVARNDVAAGDFFVLPGGPGHAVLILDIAINAQGNRVALLGQGFMPAQDFHVLRAPDGSPWFSLEGENVDTPFWVPFPWDSLRKMARR